MLRISYVVYLFLVDKKIRSKKRYAIKNNYKEKRGGGREDRINFSDLHLKTFDEQRHTQGGPSSLALSSL